ncbi:hypothetical protein HDU92_008158 [Lobulomyces angularis]|nr:hypothetical protein HDU92_008158 [Lobulomyces angularis]
MLQNEYVCLEDEVYFMLPGKLGKCTENLSFQSQINKSDIINVNCDPLEKKFEIPFLPNPPYTFNNNTFFNANTDSKLNLTCPNYIPVTISFKLNEQLPSYVLPLSISLGVFVLIFFAIIFYQYQQVRRRRLKGKYVKKLDEEKKGLAVLKRVVSDRMNKKKLSEDDSIASKNNLNKKENSVVSSENNGSSVTSTNKISSSSSLKSDTKTLDSSTPLLKVDDSKSTTIIVGSTPNRDTGGSSTWRPQGMLQEKYRVILQHLPMKNDELYISPGDVVLSEQFFEDGWVKVKRVECSPFTDSYYASLKKSEEAEIEENLILQKKELEKGKLIKKSTNFLSTTTSTLSKSSSEKKKSDVETIGLVPFHCLTVYKPGVVTIIQKTSNGQVQTSLH